MCPLYTWQDEKTKKQVTVIRSVGDIESPPNEEESGIKAEDAEWKRLMCAVSKFVRAPGWGSGQKGNW